MTTSATLRLRGAIAPLLLLLLPLPLPAPALAQSESPAGDSAATGTLIGWVTDDSRCTPVAGAEVSVGPQLAARTDASGRFTIREVPAGTHTVHVRRQGYAPAETTGVEVPAGSANDVGVALSRLEVDAAADASPDAPAEPPRVTWEPRRPKQGTLFTVIVHDTTRRWSAELAGEPLHFASGRQGTARAIAAVPISTADSVLLSLGPRTENGAGRRDTIAIPVARGEYALEKLRVAPRFGSEPDAALAERLARESKLARDVACRSRGTPRLWRPPFARPRPGRVTSGFGRGREYNGVVQSRHMGTDLAGAVGAPIRAMNRGVVALVGDFYLGGRVVYVDHGAGLVSAYLHMSKPEVAVGDTVARGQVIGRVGATGRVTGPHLHWIVRYGVVTVDPMSLFDLYGAGPDSSAARRSASRRSARSGRSSSPSTRPRDH
jgi:murein DD-endopeptidase MepM/ murein hydrolase activator NlpD